MFLNYRIGVIYKMEARHSALQLKKSDLAFITPLTQPQDWTSFSSPFLPDNFPSLQ